MNHFFGALAVSLSLWAVIACMPRAAAGQTDGPDEKTRYEYAESLYDKGAYDSAVEEFTALVKDHPKGEYADDAYYWLGRYFINSGREADGLDQFKIILALMPDADKAPAAQFELAYHWYDQSVKERDPERAMAEFLKLPFFYPQSPLAGPARYYSALCQAELGRYGEAAAELAEFAEKYPGSEYAAPALYRLGLTLFLDGRPDDALAAFQSVRDLYPAGLYSGKAMEAIELAARARDMKPLRELYRLGGKGDAPGKMSKPTGAASGPGGVLYVADTGNSRVQRFGLAGERLALETSSISPPTLEKRLMMDEPAAVAVDAAGKVYVADRGLYRVQVYSPDGELLLTFGKRGPGPGEFYGPDAVAVDEGGFIYVADKANARVSVFDRRGVFQRSLGGDGYSPDKALKSPVAVAVDLKGNLLVADSSADRVYAYDRDGALAMLYDKDPSGRFGLKDPAGIAVDGVGNVYVLDAGRDMVIMLDRDLSPLMEFPVDGPKVFDSPACIAVSGSGEVMVCDPGTSQVVVLK